MIINTNELKDILSGIDVFVPNVGLTTLKKVKMNKYLDFRGGGKSNPNPYYDQVLIEQRLSNLQTGFDYDEQLRDDMTKRLNSAGFNSMLYFTATNNLQMIYFWR